MTQGAVNLRRISQPAPEGEAKIPAGASRETAGAIALDLGPLVASYRSQRGLTLRIEELPPLGRLSAGQDNGDNSWSLALDELEGLSYFPPKGFNKRHTLKLRLTAKAKRGASPVALIDFDVVGDDDAAPPEPARKEPVPPEGGLLKKILSLKAVLAGQDAERPQFASITAGLLIRDGQTQPGAERTQSASITGDLLARKGEAQPWTSTGTQEAEIAAAKLEAAVKLKAAEAQWRDKAARAVAELTARCRATEAALASARAAAERSRPASELVALQDQLERLRRNGEAQIAAAKQAAALEAAEKLKAAEAQWRDQAARSAAELTARCRAAEAALASARVAAERPESDVAALQDRLERLRRDREVEIAAAKQAAALEAAEKLKAAEAQWQDQAARSAAELTARCRSAEAALASARAAAERPEAERAALRDQLERLRRDGEAQIAAAKQAAALEAAGKLKAAEAQWQEKAARSVAELTARCRAAEEALASARAADTDKAEMGKAETGKAETGGATDDAYVRRLNNDISSLQKSLTDREADLAQARARLEEMRWGTARPTPAGAWHPLSNRPARAEAEEAQESGHLWRDALIVFFAVMGAVLFWPRVEDALTAAGLFAAPVQQQAVIPAAPAPPPQPPKPDHPTEFVARGVNMRAEAAMSAAVIASLKSGMPVAVLGHSGNWDQVEISGADGKTLQGWVYATYLSASQPETPKNE